MLKKKTAQERSPNFRITQKGIKSSFSKVSHYFIGQQIGRGGFSTVYKALELYTKKEVAVKVINIQNANQNLISQLQSQVDILTQINHSNIIRIYETLWTDSHLFIFMEYVKGKQLFDYVCKNGPMNESLASRIFYQIVSAVRYLHEKGIAHRDIKTQNIVIDQNFNAKLIDFGFAVDITKSEDGLLSTVCGSPSYMCPQMLQKVKYDGKKVDIWCLGVVLYVMLEASLPFDHQSQHGKRKQNIRNYNWHPCLSSRSQAQRLYQSIFCHSDQRISIDTLIQSNIFYKYNLANTRTQISISGIMDEGQVDQRRKQLLMEKTAKLTNLNIQKVEDEIKNNTLGLAFSVYNILLLNKQQTKTKKQNKSVDITIQTGRSTQSRARQSHRKLYKREQSPVIKTQKKKSDKKLHKNEDKLPLLQNMKKTTIADHDKANIFLKNAQELQLEMRKTGGIRGKLKAKNMVIQQANIENFNCRLREKQAESPKRILDCVKFYH